jgi:hypothetical protein
MRKNFRAAVLVDSRYSVPEVVTGVQFAFGPRSVVLWS